MNRLLLLILLSMITCGQSLAQAYPNRSIRIVNGLSAGGPSDTVARRLASRLSDSMGQQVLVDVRAGAGGVIAAQHVARSAPDGYTLLMTTPSFAANATLQRNLPYDTLQDFSPISLVTAVPHALVVHPSVPAKKLADLIVLAKNQRVPLTFSSGTSSGSGRWGGEQFAKMAGIRLEHINYRGASDAAIAVLSGEVAVGFVDLQVIMPQISSGRVRVLAVAAERRSPVLPLIPTFQDLGYRGFTSTLWCGIQAPAFTSDDVLNRLNRELVRAINDPDFQAAQHRDGGITIGSSREHFSAFMRSEVTRFGNIIRTLGAAQ